MNESTEQLLARLEQATAVDLPGRMDDETAMLRESWEAFGELLDAADAQSGNTVVTVHSTRRAGLAMRVLAAIAASLLFAFAAWSILKQDPSSLELEQEIAAPSVLPKSAPANSEIAEAPMTGETEDVLDEFAWDDSFDEQLATTSQVMRTVQANWSGSDRRYAVLVDQIEQFSEELSDGSL